MLALLRATRAMAAAFVCLTVTLSADSPLRAEEAARTAILCAYEPEWQALLPAMSDRQQQVIGGVAFVAGRIGHADVVLVETGISMVNATMAAQLALDHFKVSRLVVMGIAGGVDPGLGIGDIVVPDQWSEYLESVFAREDHGGYALPSFSDRTQEQHYGMIFAQPVEVNRAPQPPESRRWFPADAQLLDIVRSVAPKVALEACEAKDACQGPVPKVVVGGNGVSGQAFVDNAAFRNFVRETFAARALDMESAAVAHVAYANHVPFIAFRSLSDLAGGDGGATKMKVFQDLASHNAASVLLAFLAALP